VEFRDQSEGKPDEKSSDHIGGKKELLEELFVFIELYSVLSQLLLVLLTVSC
jgi:hypothetical protein